MSFITTEQSDGDYLSNLGAFLEAAAVNAEVLGLTAGEMEMLLTEVQALDSAMVNAVTARAAAMAATTAKEAQLERLRGAVAMLAASWRANPTIPDEVLDELMVAPHKVSRRVSAPSVVRDLVLTATGGGLITLRWGAGGNIKGTVYQIECCSSPDGHWVLLDTVTARKFERVFEPGVPVWFRVRAKRGSRVSGACLPVSMWAGGAGGRVMGDGLRVAAA